MPVIFLWAVMSRDDANDVIAMATHVCKHNQSILLVAKEVITDLPATGASYLHDHLVFALIMLPLSKRKRQLNRVRLLNEQSSQPTPALLRTPLQMLLPLNLTSQSLRLLKPMYLPLKKMCHLQGMICRLSQPGPFTSQPDPSHDSSSSTSDSEPSNSSEETESDSSGKLINNSNFPLVYLKELSEY